MATSTLLKGFPVEVSLASYPHVWKSGIDLIDWQLTLGQNDSGSTLIVTIADIRHKHAEALIKHSLQSGGIQLPVAASTSETNPAVQAPESSGAVGLTSQSPERKAFLDMIAYSEGTYGKGDNGYNILVGGDKFKSYAKHPDTLVPGTNSTAAGRYQIINTTWFQASKTVGIAFTPENQDKAAVLLIQGRGALADVDAGNATAAINKCRKEWASFPGAGYGQKENSLKTLTDFYNSRLKFHKSGGVSNKPLSVASKAPVVEQTGLVEATVDSSSGVVKGNLLTISIGSKTFESYHSSTYLNHEGRTVITGQGVRWVLNRRKRNRTLANIDLRTLATQVAKSHGVQLLYQSSFNPEFLHIDQTGISDYELLTREAKNAGLFVSEDSRTLTIKELSDIRDSQFIMAYGLNLLAFPSIEDRAVQNGIDDGSGLLQAEDKMALNPVTGQFQKTKPEIDTVKDKSVSGKPTTTSAGKQTDDSSLISALNRSRVKRVKGLPATFEVVLSVESLSLTPLSAARTINLPGILSRVWLIDTITHSGSTGKTMLQCYSPVEVVDYGNAFGFGSNPANTPNQNQENVANLEVTGNQQFIKPYSGSYRVSSPYGMRSHPLTGRTKLHGGTDIPMPEGTSVFASASGTVRVANNNPGGGKGAGKYVEILHANGISTLYMHLSSVNTSVGKTVKQGEFIGKSGNTGGSTGAHLHFEFRKGGSSFSIAQTNLGAKPSQTMW